MIKGNKKLVLMSNEDLFYYTNGGKDIYQKYIKNLHRGSMKRPWGTDNHPSFGVYQAKDGVWMWKDIAKEESGNSVQFIQKLFNLEYKDAVEKIMSDFGLTDKEVLVDKVYEQQVIQDKQYRKFSVKTMRFKERHHQFWNCVEVSEDWCKKKNCFAVKELAIDRVKVPIGEHERVFAYYAEDIDRVKVYFPDREQNGKFRTNVPYRHLWNINKVPCCDKMVIHKSNKDEIVFSLLFANNIVTQNESIKLFDQETVNRINSVSKEPWVFFGSDPDGVLKCTKITETTNWRYINTPKELLPSINDIYSFVKHYNLKELEKFCKKKGLL